VNQRDRRSLTDFGLVEPLLREGVPPRHLIISSDLADAQVVVSEDFVAALLLDFVMVPAGAPADERLLVPPARKRKDPSLAGQALVADVVNEALFLLQLGAQHLGVVEVVIPVLPIWEDLKNH